MATVLDQTAPRLPALTLALLAAVWAASLGAGGAQELLTMSKADKQGLLDTHNLFRARTAKGNTGSQPPAGDMMLLEYDDRLQAKAANWAAQCTMGHDTAADRAIPGHSWVGQNWAGGGNTNLSYYVELWYNEHVDYTFDTKHCTVGKQCGHYTQVVWARSLLLGCAAAVCENYGGRVLVCNYANGGNVQGHDVYEKATTAASACIGEFTFKRNGLCRRKNQCSNTATGGAGGGTGTGGGAGPGVGTTTPSSVTTPTTVGTTTTAPSGGGDWGDWGDWGGDGGWEEGLTMGRRRRRSLQLARQRRQADDCPCALTCKNGGTLDEVNCKCSCTPDFYGTRCEVTCEDPSAWRSNCEGDPDACKNFPTFCPKTCGGCRTPNITDTAAVNSDGVIARA